LHVKAVWSGINTTLVQDAVVVPGLEDAALAGIAPCFDPDLLQELITATLKDNLAPYLDETRWNTEFLFSLFQSGEAYPQQAEIHFHASYYGTYRYEGTKKFQVRKGSTYGQ
jgi:hypothetical protein